MNAEPARCTCPECRDLDRQHPTEGWQMRLIAAAGDADPGPPPLRPETIVEALRTARLRSSNEAALQTSIGERLTARGIAFEREAVLGPGERIDFLAGGVGIEAKARYNRRAIYRQLERYAGHQRIDALVLVTGTALGLPPALNGKPLFLVSIGRGSL